MFAWFTLRKINSAASRLSSWVSKSNTLSKSSARGNKRRHFKTHWLSKSAISKLRRSKRALLVVLLLASSAVALASLGVWRAVTPAPSLAHGATSAGRVNAASPATTDPPFTKLKEYVYAGGRLVTSEEISCVPTFSPASASLSKDSQTGSFNFSMPSICNWTATSNATSWLTVTSGASGSGAGAVGYSVAANSGPQRVGTITVNGQAFTVTQAPNQTSCNYSLNTPGKSVSEQASSDFFQLTTGAGCAWTATSNATSWLTVNPPTSGSGSATINYSVTANGGAQRVGIITVGGQTFTVTQAPLQASCAFALSPGSQLIGVGGGSGSFSVTTGAGCFWDAATADGWITITGGATGVGNGAVSFTVQANNGGSRTGSISVRGQVFTITQCGYTVSPTSASFDQFGGAGSVTVSSAAVCSWSAASNAPWITITSGASGAGNGSVNLSVASYGVSNGYREGTLTIAGRTVTIGQFGPTVVEQPPCCTQRPFCICDPSLLTALDQSATDAEPRGLTARYFSNTTLSGQPSLQRTDAAVSFTWVGNRPDAALPADRFSVRWDGQLAAPSSEAYTFYLYSDDGARLWVNNRLVIDRWQPPFEPQNRSAPVELKAGAKVDIRVEYYDAEGDALIHLLWSSASTPRQIIPRRHLYPEAATNKSAPADINKQTGMLLPPGSDACPKATCPQPNAPNRWLASPLSQAGLVLLIACGVSALLLGTVWRQAGRRFAMAAADIMSRLRDQIAARLGELFRIAAAVSDKLQFVVGFGKRLLAGTLDKLKFVGHFLAAFSPIFKVVSRGGAVMRLGKQKLAGLLPERVQVIARRALSLWLGLGLGRLKPVLRRALAIAMIVILATPLGPAQADGLGRAARATWRTMSAAANRYGASSDSDTFDRLIKALGKRPGKVVSAAAQAEQVTVLQVCPTQHIMFVGECYTFTPVALDSSNKVVHGAAMSWSSLTPAVATVSSFGEVEAVAVGTTTVTVQSGSVSTQIQIEVQGGTRPKGSNQQADLDPPTNCGDQQASMFAPQSAAGAPAQQSLIGADGVLYDGDPNPAPGSLATHFRNAVGNPRFTATSQASAAVPTSTQLGSYNYQFNVPVVSVGGRGASANIGMTLNSRVWNTDNGKLTFNYVGAYPGPGWSMGYGKIIRNYNATATGDGSGIGSGNSPGDYLLVTGDGTRIRLAAKYDNVSRWFHESDDGSFLQFNPISGEMLYPDGTRMIYGSVNGVLLPTAMIGTNGGAITMTYRDYCEGACVRPFRHRTALSAVRDTLGRYVTFHYYGDNDYTADPANGHPAGELAAIKAPDTSGLQQEVIRVEYQLVTLKYDFGSLAVDAPANNTQIQLVRRIYYPQTGRGFLFLDYSSYGMPRKISSRNGMKGAAGAITDGTEIAYTKYNYTTIDPSDPYDRNQVGHLSDFPQFTLREEWWQGKTDAAGAPTTDTTKYDYSRTMDSSTNTEVDTIKYVDRNYEEATTRGTDSSQLSFGKVISVERRTSSPPQLTLSKQVLTYVTGPDGEVEVGTVETIDEAGQGRLLKFGYGQYGRVIDKSECGYKQTTGYQIIRRTHYDYFDDSNYLAARFLHLVSRTSVYDALNNNNLTDDVLKAKTETVYDGYTDPAVGGIENYGLTSGQYPPNHDSAYDQNKTLRGNATAVKTFSQLTPAEVSTTRHAKYDIFGNVVQAEVSCCVKKSFSFSGLTAYSEPDSIQSGDTGGLNLQTNYRYNYFTGLVERETNPDGVWTDYGYDKALRLNTVNSQIGVGAVTQFDQDGNGNDLLTYLSQTTYDDQGTQKVITSRHWSDGAGRVLRAGTGAGSAPNSYDMTATIYDGWGRVTKQSNPYLGDANGDPQSGVTQFWTTNTYDELSRVTQVTLPDTPNNQTIHTDYNGATTTSGATVIVTDTVGRKRKSEVDGLGRLVKVTEQNPANGNLEWETSYSYDVLNNLIQTNQGGQLRTFAYDSKGRITSETTPEAGKTDYTYTDFSAVSTRRDARGVITTYTYGDLNLLTGVSYDTSQATGVALTAAVSITYKNASPGKGQIVTVTDGAGDDGESYTYDSFGRLQSCTRVIDGISYQKQYEYNEANQMTLMTYPSGKRVNVGRDDRGRLSAVKKVDASGALLDTYLSGINYRADGLISSQNLGDSTTENFGYSNDRLQLTSQKVMKGGSTLLDLTYVYAAAAGQMGSSTIAGNSGQLVSVTGTINGQNRNQAFTYDNVGRLATATGLSTQGAWARRYEYDRYGNRTAVFDAVSGGNQLQHAAIMNTNRIDNVDGIVFRYDASGNLTWDGARTYGYDAENRLVSVSTVSGGESYSYDASNHRVKKVVGGVVTHYVLEGDRMIAEYERGGGSTQATGTRYYHKDRLSTRLITDGAGNVKGATDHLPFGEEIGFTGESEKHKFTTYERDGALDYAVNRHYDPQRGRFAQADPLGMGAANLAEPQSLNLYSYVQNDPVNFTDPLGLVRPGDICSTNGKDNDGIIGNDGKCHKALKGDNSVTIRGGSSNRVIVTITIKLNPNPIILLVGERNGSRRGGGGNLKDLHTELDIIGLCPWFGEWADATNAVIYGAEGNFGQAALSGMATLPFLGWLATGGKVGQKAVSITMDEAIEQGVKHVGGDGIMEVTGKGTNFQFRSTVKNASGQIETRVARFDINPADPHVQQLGPHLNLETRIGKKKVGTDPHTPIDPSTIRKGDCP